MPTVTFTGSDGSSRSANITLSGGTQPLLAPINHGEVLFFDNFANDEMPKWNDLSCPIKFAPGATPYIFNEGVSPSPFSVPWDGPPNPVARQCHAPIDRPAWYDGPNGPGPTGAARTGFYQGYEYDDGEHSITYIDFKLQSNQATVFPKAIANGGGNTYYSQLLQLKTWEAPSEPDAEFFSLTQGRNGIKSHFGKNRLGNELLLTLTPGRWYRLGIEANWRSGAGGWIQLFMNDQDASVMRPVHARQAMDARTMMTPLGHTWFCLGPYHRREEFTGDVRTEYANACVRRVP